MNYRGVVPFATLLSCSACSVAMAGCFEESRWDGGGYADNEIVFGISEHKAVDGTVSTSVGYEFLDVRDHGWNARGFVSDGRSCWAERLDDRLGQPRVAGGVATFTGGVLPSAGIAVVANRADDLVLPAPAWTQAREPLTFQATGFAMPDVAPATLRVPSTELDVLLPEGAAAEVAVSAAQELELTWAPGEATEDPENVVVSLVAAPEGQPASRGVELRCFFDRRDGKGQLPKKMMDRFAALVGGDVAAPIKGTLHMATHRQLTSFADGGWAVYVVASVDQREQPFVLQR